MTHQPGVYVPLRALFLVHPGASLHNEIFKSCVSENVEGHGRPDYQGLNKSDIKLRWNIYGRLRETECHIKIMQPIPSTKRQRKLLKTEATDLQVNDSRKISSLFPN